MGFGGISIWQLLIVAFIAFVLFFRGGSNPMVNLLKRPILSFFLAFVIYSWIGIAIYDANPWDPAVPMTAYFIYLAVSATLSYGLLRYDEKHRQDVFKREGAFDNYGTNVYEFEYHFHAKDWGIAKEVLGNLISAVSSSSEYGSSNTTITDADRRFKPKDEREFLKIWKTETKRGGRVTELLRACRTGDMYGIQWWFLIMGDYSKSRVFTFVLFSPFSIIFWIIPKLLGRHNLSNSLREIYPAFYERLDILTAVKAANKLTMDTLISTLEEHGVDISDLKTQQAQVMNISISGGKATFGSIIQGTLNRAKTVGATNK